MQLLLARVDEQDADVGGVHDAVRPKRAVVLDAVLDLRLAPKPRRVHEDQRLAVIAKLGVDRVPRGAGDLRDDHAILPDEPVHEAGLADVGLADDRHPDHCFVGLLGSRLGQGLGDAVEQIP